MKGFAARAVASIAWIAVGAICSAVGTKAAHAYELTEWTVSGVGTFQTRSAAETAMRAQSTDNSHLNYVAATRAITSDQVGYIYRSNTSLPSTATEWTFFFAGSGLPFASEEDLVAVALTPPAPGGICTSGLTSFVPTSPWTRIVPQQSSPDPEGWPIDEQRWYEGVGCGVTFPVQIVRLRHIECPAGLGPAEREVGSACVSNRQDTIWKRPVTSDACEYTGNPVCVVTGNKMRRDTDYDGAGLTFVRTYHSMEPEPLAGVGAAWTHNYAARLWFDTDPLGAGQPLMARLQNGLVERLGATGLQDVFVGRSGRGLLLRRVGTQWILHQADNSELVFASDGLLARISDANGVTDTLEYTNGRLTGITTQFGHRLSLEYDTSGRISALLTPGTQRIEYEYSGASASANLIRVRYPDLSTLEYRYEAGAQFPNHLTSVVDQAGVTHLSIEYDLLGRATRSSLSGNAEAVTLSYSPGATILTTSFGSQEVYFRAEREGDLSQPQVLNSVVRGGAPIRQISYGTSLNDPLQRPVAVTGRDGIRTCFSYGFPYDQLLPDVVTQACSTPLTRTLTRQFNVQRPWQIAEEVLGGSPSKRINKSFDSRGRLLTRTITDTSVSPNASRTWIHTWDSFGRMLTEDGPRESTIDRTVYTYYTCTTGSQCGQLQTITDPAGNVTTYNEYNAHGQPIRITDANNIVTRIAYDTRQRLTRRCVNGAALPACAGGELTVLDYYPTGLLKRVTEPDGAYVDYSYDAAHRLTGIRDNLNNRIAFTLDAMGNRTVEAHYDPSNTLRRAHGRVFNSLNQLSREVQALDPGTLDPTTAPLSRATQFGYDANGNQTTVTVPLETIAGNTSTRIETRTFDELNRLRSSTHTSGATNLGQTQFEYDARDNLTRVTDPENLVTQYAYSGFDELTTLTSPDTGVTEHTYHPYGGLETKTDARGASIGRGIYAYDGLGRVISISYPNTADNITYTWDNPCPNGRGRLCSFTDRSGTTSFEYDAYGRTTRKTQALQVPGAGTQTRSVQYAYTNGRLARITYPSGYQVNYSFDAAGRISGITGKSASTATPTTILSSVTYDPFDQVTGWTWGNGTTTSRSFDRDGRVTSITSAGGANYNYDDGDRIRAITPTAGSTVPSSIYGYEAMDRLSSAQTGANSQGFTYDRNGNRLAQSGSINATYNYPRSGPALLSNRLTTSTGGTARTMQYDAMGNVLGDGIHLFEYDGRGRLSKANQYGVIGNPYYSLPRHYNALGQRVFRAVWSGYPRTFVFDEAGKVLENCWVWRASLQGPWVCEPGATQLYIWLGDIPVAAVLRTAYYDSEGFLLSEINEDALYLHTDHLNTPRRMTLASEAINPMVWRWDPDAFGVGYPNRDPLNTYPSTGGYRSWYNMDLRFPGQLFDEETWRHYNYFRDYDPYTGRYLQSDPIGLLGGVNTYGYVAGNPISNVDPTGELLVPVIWGVRVGYTAYRAYRFGRAAAAAATAAAASTGSSSRVPPAVNDDDFCPECDLYDVETELARGHADGNVDYTGMKIVCIYLCSDGWLIEQEHFVAPELVSLFRSREAARRFCPVRISKWR